MAEEMKRSGRAFENMLRFVMEEKQILRLMRQLQKQGVSFNKIMDKLKELAK